MQSMMKGLKKAYIGRKLKKRDFRGLWIQRINAAARELGISYSQFINGLAKANIIINRKMLADIAVNDKIAFAKLVDQAKAALV
jgi:large subunit ribosomal protein L20